MSGTEEEKKETRGRKPKVLDLEQMGKLASIHCSVEEIALVMGVNKTTIYRNDEYMEVIEQGRARGKMGLRRKQWEAAANGSNVMLVWLGKNWLGQTDEPQNPEDAKPLPWDDSF